MKRSTAIFLVLLRLAVGWHFLFEGTHKLQTFYLGETTTSKPFTSEGYFREAPGPFAWAMRQEVGDPDDSALDHLTVAPPPADQDSASAKPYQRMPPGLKRDWDEYFKEFADFYALDPKQRELAHAKLEQNESNVGTWLTLEKIPGKDDDAQPEEVKKALLDVEKTLSGSPSATLKVKETPAQRIAEYRAKVQEAREALEKKDAYLGRDVEGARRLQLKSEAAKMRGELLDALGKKTADMKTSLYDDDLLTDEQRQKGMTLPPGNATLMWWIDGVTAWTLTVTGACLLVGLFTRTNCVAAAGFLLMTYFASPPWPWLPTPPNTEGNYAFINKNVVEMFALLVLATTASGRWLGLDAWIYGCWTTLFGKKQPAAPHARRAA